MIINLGNSSKAALPPTIVGGGNAPSKPAAPGDPFANVLALVNGSNVTSAAGPTRVDRSTRANRMRGAAGAGDDPPDAAAPADHDADDVTTAVAVPTWLWVVPGLSSGSFGASTGSITAATSELAGADRSLPSSDANTALLPGAAAALSFGMAGVPLAHPAGESAPPIGADDASLSTGSQDASTSVSARRADATTSKGRSIMTAAQIDSSSPSTGGRAASVTLGAGALAKNVLVSSPSGTAAPVIQADSSKLSPSSTDASVLSNALNARVAAGEDVSLASSGQRASQTPGNGVGGSTSETATPATPADLPNPSTGSNRRIDPAAVGSGDGLQKMAAPPVRDDSSAPQSALALAASAVSTPVAGRTSGAGRAAGRPETAGASATVADSARDQAAAQLSTAVAARQSLSPESSTPTARTTENVRSDDKSPGAATVRATNLSSSLADGRSAVAFASLAGSARNETAQNPAGGDSQSRFADSRGGPDDVEAQAAAQALDSTVVAAALHADHASPTSTGPVIESGHMAALEKTTLTSAVPFLFESPDRSSAIEDGTLHRQIVQAIQLQSRSGIGEARLTLQPEYLGDVTIALRVEDGGVTAHVSAAAADVRAWLGANEAILGQGLAEHGLTLNRLVVSDQPADTPRDTKDGAPRQQPQPQQDTPQQRPRPRPDTSTFEITV